MEVVQPLSHPIQVKFAFNPTPPLAVKVEYEPCDPLLQGIYHKWQFKRLLSQSSICFVNSSHVDDHLEMRRFYQLTCRQIQTVGCQP